MRPKTAKLIQVFLASPGDVARERRAAQRAIAWVSDHVAKPQGWRVEPRMWERDVLPGSGKDAQSIINEQIGEMRTIDVFVLIMRDRFGTPTPRAGSGTEEEYDRAVAARKGRREPKRPHLLLFFGEPSPKAEPSQSKKVEAFKSEAGKTAMWVSFRGVADFERQFRDVLTKWTTSYLSATGPSGKGGARPPSSAKNAMLLGDRVYRVVRFEGNGRFEATISIGSPADERSLRRLLESRADIPFAFGLLGGRVSLGNAEFVSQAGDPHVRVVLYPSHRFRGEAMDAESREKIVRRVLLGEPMPKAPPSPYGLTSAKKVLPAVIPPIVSRRDDDARGWKRVSRRSSPSWSRARSPRSTASRSRRPRGTARGWRSKADFETGGTSRERSARLERSGRLQGALLRRRRRKSARRVPAIKRLSERGGS